MPMFQAGAGTVATRVKAARRHPSKPARDDAMPGTRGIERVAALLRVLATRTQYGWALTQLAEEAGLKKTTAHRMLAKLECEGLVSRRASDHRYFLGPTVAELSLGLPGFHGFMEACASSMDDLSRTTGAAAMLAIRSGIHSVVAARTGPSAGRGMMTEVGGRRPLLASSAGTAIFLGLPAAEQERVRRLNIEVLRSRNAGELEALKRMWARSDALGYGFSMGDVIPGVTSIALALRSPGGVAFASIALIDESASFTKTKAQEAAMLIRREVDCVMSRGYPEIWFESFDRRTGLDSAC
ncbi:IclR family transcriptional regulator [Variovorax sp. KK3]|uniref:IclR family transcriptional regulator n=1 Tax=Variovorax sp. KK3 TaxID=1855728 RepID=UPI0009FB22C9|nr:helix-turn-helix domain-containing protein [Variovorax sp. KK3]